MIRSPIPMYARFFPITSIRSRLLIYFMLLILLPTSIISATIYYRSTHIITEKTNSALRDKLNIIDANIVEKFNNIDGIATEIYLNKDLIHILSTPHPTDTTQIVNEMSVIDKLLSNYTVTDTSQHLFVPKIYIFNRPEYLLYSFTDKVSDISRIENKAWYTNLPARAEYTVVGTKMINIGSTNVNTLEIAKRLFALDDTSIQFSGVLTINIGLDYFNQILANSKPTSGSSTFVVDDNHSVLISPSADLLGTDLSSQRYMARIAADRKPYDSFIEHNGRTLIAYQRIEALHWTIVSLTPLKELNGELMAFNRIIDAVILGCTLFAFILALLLSNDISYPIRKLVASMKSVQRGNFNVVLSYKRNDEFSYLFYTYQKMVGDIKELIDKLYVSEVNKKEAELKALQAQINPHFLYNTLDSVNWMAMELHADNISTMVTSLSDFFRYSLSKGQNIITIHDEKMQIENYLKIQKIRFQDKLDYTLEFDGETLDCLTVKLILQPLVENAILHGINQIRGKGKVDIRCGKQTSLIVIQITDNGAGADVEELNAMLQNRQDSASFGLKNVNERIKHYFGEGYGIKFTDNDAAGITATVCFPAVKTMEGYYVDNDHSGR